MNNESSLPYNLNPSQQSAVESPINGPLLIVAGAGSGKTTTLTARLNFLLSSGLSPSNLIAITFTNKAAGEMRQRISRELSLPAPNLFIGTFHALGLRILKTHTTLVNRTRAFSIYDRDDSIRLLKSLIKDYPRAKEFSASVFLNRLSSLKNQNESPANLATSDAKFDKLCHSIFTLYEDALTKNNAFDFDDLIEKPVRLLTSHPDLLSSYQAKWTHVLVDEYQDVNPVQYRLLRLLAGPSANLNVVGDDNQAIYRFRGADYTNFLNFDKDFKDAKVVLLEENYRSTENIINASSSLIKHNKFQRPKTLWTKNKTGSLVKIIEHDDSDTEGGWLAGEILNLSSPSTAILYRTNAQSRAIEQALIESGCPYHLFGGLKFYDRKEIKDIVSVLRFANNPSDSVSFDRLYQNLYKKPWRELATLLPDRVNSLSPAELIKLIINKSDYVRLLNKRFPNATERLDNLRELTRFASEFDSLPAFLEKILLFESADGHPANGVISRPLVTLMTIHLAKGLEFDNVYVAGVGDGLIPHERSLLSQADIEEERRLLYVGMTRAKQNLTLSFFDLPSRFLSEINPSFIEFNSAFSLDLDDEDRYISI